MKERFKNLLAELTQGVYEKDTEIGLSLLAAIAGESVLLLGPPGVAKSMVARRVKCAFGKGKSFEYLMSRFSTPDEIFGPVSISKLKESDLYERNIDGFMPTADVVFLDEVWKAGPAILNTLLTIINEKVFRNGCDEIHVPLKLLIGASNELPADGEGLEALWDRFLVRIVSGCVGDENNFYKILQQENSQALSDDVKVSKPITLAEYRKWSKEISKIELSKQVLDAITYIRKHIVSLHLDDTVEVANRIHNIYVSDRRWQHIAHLLRASAYVHGRTSVEVYDLIPLVYCLWSDPDEIEPLRRVVIGAALSSLARSIERLKTDVKAELRGNAVRVAQRELEMKDDHRDDRKELFDGYYYRIDNYDLGNTFIFFVDYKNLPAYSRDKAPYSGIIYSDPHHKGRTIIRTHSDPNGMQSNGVGAMKVKLYRDNNNIFINGVRYPIHMLPEGVSQPPVKGPGANRPVNEYEIEVEALTLQLLDFNNHSADENIFASGEERKELQRQIKSLSHEIAVLRNDIEKLICDGE